MGRIKYISIMSVPLVYYIFPFQNYFGGLLFPWLLYSPATITIPYIIIFSATKQSGRFCVQPVVLETSSELLYDTQVRKADTFICHRYYDPLWFLANNMIAGPYLSALWRYYTSLLTFRCIPSFSGIYIAVMYISQDSKLRKEFYKKWLCEPVSGF